MRFTACRTQISLYYCSVYILSMSRHQMELLLKIEVTLLGGALTGLLQRPSCKAPESVVVKKSKTPRTVSCRAESPFLAARFAERGIKMAPRDFCA